MTEIIMKLTILLFIVLTISLSATENAVAQTRPTGLNCDLSKPPASAGEEFNHGIILRIHPRAKDITKKYSGCQVMFAPKGQGWIVISLTEVLQGDPVRVWQDRPSDPMALSCLYSNGQVTRGDPDKCPAHDFLLAKSLAPGCVKLLQNAAAQNSILAKWPDKCSYE